MVDLWTGAGSKDSEMADDFLEELLQPVQREAQAQDDEQDMQEADFWNGVGEEDFLEEDFEPIAESAGPVQEAQGSWQRGSTHVFMIGAGVMMKACSHLVGCVYISALAISGSSLALLALADAACSTLLVVAHAALIVAHACVNSYGGSQNETGSQHPNSRCGRECYHARYPCCNVACESGREC